VKKIEIKVKRTFLFKRQLGRLICSHTSEVFKFACSCDTPVSVLYRVQIARNMLIRKVVPKGNSVLLISHSDMLEPITNYMDKNERENGEITNNFKILLV
jgi:hypothetical protein